MRCDIVSAGFIQRLEDNFLVWLVFSPLIKCPVHRYCVFHKRSIKYPEILRPHRLAWPRTPAFQAGNTGSNPVGDAIKKSRWSFLQRLFFYFYKYKLCINSMVYRVLNEIDCYHFTRWVKFDMVNITRILCQEDCRIFFSWLRDRASLLSNHNLANENHSRRAVQ